MSSTPLTPTPDAAVTPETDAAPTTAAAPAAVATMTPEACASQLKQLFPALFTGGAKPLKLRIQADIQERAPGQFTKPVLSAFLRRYTGGTGYLIAVSRATHRFDLDGAPVAELSDEHRQVAVEELARRRERQNAKRAEQEQEQRQRASLLRDFERTTLTPANFCALKGVAPEALEGLLALARQEAAQAPAERPQYRQRPERGGGGGNGGGGVRDRGFSGRPPRRAEGERGGNRGDQANRSGDRGDRPGRPANAAGRPANKPPKEQA